jgi:two-component system, sensor histidine kinase
MNNFHSLRRRMVLLTLLPLLLSAIALTLILLHGRFADLDQNLLDKSQLIARQLATSSEYGVFSNNQEFLMRIAQSGLKEADVSGVMLLDANHNVLVQVGEFSQAQLSFKPITLSNNTQLSRANMKFELAWMNGSLPWRDDEKRLWVFQAISSTQINLDDVESHLAPVTLGSVIVEVSKTRTLKLKQRMWFIALATSLLLLSATFYLVIRASRKITYPIQQLSLAVQMVGRGEWRKPLALKSNIVELSTLVEGLNNMVVILQKDRNVMQRQIDLATRALRDEKELAEQATQQKSIFLAVASHDLRQPLHALGLYVAELSRQLSASAEYPLVEKVEQSVDALTTLLNALLDISKLDAGAVVPQLQSCSLAHILGRVANDYRMLAQMKNIHLVVHSGSGFVRSDPVLLERILMNLVSNALRYTPENGCVLIACRKRENQWCIEVRDNGGGISAADQVNIFREFMQVAHTEFDSNTGLGLGLAIVDRLVKLLGHRLQLRSALKQGSCFALYLPSALAADRLASTGVHPAFSANANMENLPLDGVNLLVVDDDELVLTSTGTILNAWGGQVSLAKSVDEVRGLLEQGAKWDFIISDYQLSDDETGLDIMRMIRANRHADIQGILMSGDTSPELLQHASVVGLHLMHKPVKPAKLRSLILFLLNDVNDVTE